MAARGVISAWRAGWHLLWRNKRMWLWIWAIHVAGAAVLAGIFSSIWSELLGGTLAAGEFGGPRTANIVVDLFANHYDALRGLFPGAALLDSPLGFVFVLYAWLGVILAAGILAGLSRSIPVAAEADDEDSDAVLESVEVSSETELLAARGEDLGLPFLGRFLRDCGTYAGRFTRLMIVHLVAMAVILLSLAALLGRISDALLGATPDPVSSTRASLVVLAIVAFFYLVLTLVGDYAKVRMVREKRRSAILAWVAGLRWAIRRLPRTLALHFIFVLIAALGSALYWYVSSSTGVGGTVVLLVLVQQAYLVFRAGLRVHWYAAELSLYDGLK
jgi:hypothetical protein